MANVEKQSAMAQELSSKIWEMANALRGNMDASEYKNYILGLIFYRYLCLKMKSWFEEMYEEDFSNYKIRWDEGEIYEDATEDCGYAIAPEYLFEKMIEMIDDGTFDVECLEKAINSIEESSKGTAGETAIENVFEDMDLKSSKLGKTVQARTDVIKKVLLQINLISFDFNDEEVDVLGSAYMILIAQFASTAGKKGGEFYTPSTMSKLVSKLATIGKTDALTVCDPACGSGSLLLQVKEDINTRKLVGIELNSSTYNLARMNMLLHGLDYEKFQIYNGNTIEEQLIDPSQKFEIQVANPPYSANWNPESAKNDPRYSAYGKMAPASKADFAFVQHMLYHMADGDSRAVVLLPHGILFRGSGEAVIRKRILTEMNCLDAVIGLPSNCFHGTGIPVCCLVFKNDRGTNKDNVLFIDASKDFVAGKAMNYIAEEHIDKIVNAYTSRKDIDKYCRVVSMKEIAENEYNLNIPRYVDTCEEEETIDINAVRADLQKHQEESRRIDAELEDFFKQLGL